MTTQPTARQRLIDAMQADTCFCGADSCQTAEEYVDAFARELAAAAPAADRAAVLREVIERVSNERFPNNDFAYGLGAEWMVSLLERIADEAQQDGARP